MLDFYGTLGPRCADVTTLRAMLDAGMTGMRLNLSHITLIEAEKEIEALHTAASLNGVKARLLIDMQGPELRIGALAHPLTLREGETVTLGADGIPIPMIALPCLVPGARLLLDDGKLLLKVTTTDDVSVRAEVMRGGTLTGRKSLAIPGAELHPPTMTEADLANIAMAKDYGVTGVMQPFVRDRADLEAVRAALDRAGGREIRLFAKIENREGVRNLDGLIAACDEIVIARGDLGNAVPLWELPRVQKEIAAKCREQGRAFMVVTQMLASMEHAAVPTRAEVSDVFNAVLDGASSVMLTGETAVGDYPVEAMRYLVKTAGEAARYMKNR